MGKDESSIDGVVNSNNKKNNHLDDNFALKENYKKVDPNQAILNVGKLLEGYKHYFLAIEAHKKGDEENYEKNMGKLKKINDFLEIQYFS